MVFASFTLLSGAEPPFGPAPEDGGPPNHGPPPPEFNEQWHQDYESRWDGDFQPSSREDDLPKPHDSSVYYDETARSSPENDQNDRRNLREQLQEYQKDPQNYHKDAQQLDNRMPPPLPRGGLSLHALFVKSNFLNCLTWVAVGLAALLGRRAARHKEDL